VTSSLVKCVGQPILLAPEKHIFYMIFRIFVGSETAVFGGKRHHMGMSEPRILSLLASLTPKGFTACHYYDRSFSSGYRTPRRYEGQQVESSFQHRRLSRS
jgi:hypothetical protein